MFTGATLGRPSVAEPEHPGSVTYTATSQLRSGTVDPAVQRCYRTAPASSTSALPVAVTVTR